MSDLLVSRLQHLAPELLRGLRRGVEKEGLRATLDGSLALTPHPPGLGSALTHPHVTTDFSESQLELITGVHADIDACLAELQRVHQFVYRHLDQEIIWGSSMPCRLPPDAQIPIGVYGSSNVGRAKTVYRQGLSYRYGRRMQTISGVHYNFSLPEEAWPLPQQIEGRRAGSVRDYKTEAYFALIRNFRRHSWLLLYLFGASPAVCRSFLDGHAHNLEEFDACTLYLPYATSLRMGPLGYQSNAQASLRVSYNSFASYAGSLHRALTEPYPPYEAAGLRDGDEYRQLSTTLLQIENEFYSTIRPKRPVYPGERPLHALGERGVEYVEVRCMDIDPFSPIGIEASTMRFLDVFLVHCLIEDSPPDTPEEIERISQNQHRVAQRGREPGLMLAGAAGEVSLRDWGERLLDAFEPIAALLDGGVTTGSHRAALREARRRLADPAATPSARVLSEMRGCGDDGAYRHFALALSLQHRDALCAQALDEAHAAALEALAARSIVEQQAIENSDTTSFEEYRRQYLEQALLMGQPKAESAS